MPKKASRRDVDAILAKVGVSNKYTLRMTRSRDRGVVPKQVAAIKDWRPDSPDAGEVVKQALNKIGVLVVFEGPAAAG